MSTESESDEEIFFGPLTLKQAKNYLLRINQHKPWAASAVKSPRKHEDDSCNGTENMVAVLSGSHKSKVLNSILESNKFILDKSPNKILKKTEELNNISDSNEYILNRPLINDVKPEFVIDKRLEKDTFNTYISNREDDSFIALENMVEHMCENTTLEITEYILNNPPSRQGKPSTVTDDELNNVIPVVRTEDEVLNEVCLKKLHKISPSKKVLEKEVAKDSLIPLQNTPPKTDEKYIKEARLKPPKAYQHIRSPVAFYIKNGSITPCVKDTRLKPLRRPSQIPKLVNAYPPKQNNKNFNIPSVAYKGAKKTELVNLPAKKRLPQRQWASKVTGGLPIPVLIKHDNREQNFAKRIP